LVLLKVWEERLSSARVLPLRVSDGGRRQVREIARHDDRGWA